MNSINFLWCQMSRFYCPLKRRDTFLPEGIDVHIQQHIHQKDLNLCLTSYDYVKVIDELEKNTNKKFSCVMVFIIRRSSTFQFIFGFNESLWVSGSIFGLWLYEFWFYNTNDFESLLTPCRWIKILSAKTTKKGICKKEV